VSALETETNGRVPASNFAVLAKALCVWGWSLADGLKGTAKADSG